MSETEFYNKGTQLCSTGRYEKAIEWFDKALRINPNHADTLGNKGVALMNLGRHEEAIECYDKALRINPNDANTLSNKGSALVIKGVDLYNDGQYGEAIEWFDKALRINPDDTNALNSKKAAQDAMKRRIANASVASNLEALRKTLEEAKWPEKLPKSSVARNNNLDDEFSALNINSKNKRFDVFISYSWKQKKQARNLFNFLIQSGLSCWIDDNQLQAGDKLSQELADAIFNSKLVIFCISKEYLNSVNCQREFDYAFKFKKAFIPVLFCRDEKREFGSWPCHHGVFFTLGDALYISDIFNDLDTSNTNTSESLNKFIRQVKQKL